MKKFLLAGLFLLPSLAIGAEPINLSFNPEKGTKYDYRMEMTQDINQSAAGMNIPIKSEMMAAFRWEVKDKTAQETQLQVTYRELAQTITSSLVNMKYDSRKPNENSTGTEGMIGKMLGGMIGKSLTMTITADGSVKSITGMEAIIDGMAQAADGAPPEMAAEMRKQFGDVAMKGMFEQSLKFYPSSPIRSGDSWNVEIAIPMGNMNTGIKSRYTLKNVKKNMATIAFVSDLTVDVAELGTGARLTGTQTGTVVVDVRTGMPLTGDMLQNVKGSFEVQGVNVQMGMVSKLKMSTKEAK